MKYTKSFLLVTVLAGVSRLTNTELVSLRREGTGHSKADERERKKEKKNHKSMKIIQVVMFCTLNDISTAT